MIIVRSPLRIPLGGGGTDLPSYYERFGGYVVSAAIDKYVYVAINSTFDSRIRLKYTTPEIVDTAGQVKHPIIREVLKKYKIQNGIEISSMADVPAGTGLGSSGAFSCAVIKGVATHIKSDDKELQCGALAELACDIEINKLKEPVGKQDPYISACGGIQEMEFKWDGATTKPVSVPDETLYELGKNLKLYFTGFQRSASSALSVQNNKTMESDPGMLENLHMVKQIGIASAHALKHGDLLYFAELMEDHWELKQKRGTTTPEINKFYEVGIENGALAGKLVGAGLGGFMLFFTREPDRLTHAMTKLGLRELPIWFDFRGTQMVEIS